MLSEAEYHRPTDVGSACRLLAENDEAVVVAGGQSLALLTRAGIVTPGALIDINHIESLQGCRKRDGELWIGALTTHRIIETSELVAEAAPILAEAAGRIADVQVRNAGTIGGVAAYADPTADYPPVFLALDATIAAQTAEEQTEYPADEFFVGYYESALDDDELVTAVRLPVVGPNEGAAFEKLALRENDRAIVNAAAWVAVEDGTCTNARIGVGGPTDRPELAVDAALHLVDTELGESERNEAAATARNEIRVVSDPSLSEEYRATMVENLVRNALATATDRAGGNP